MGRIFVNVENDFEVITIEELRRFWEEDPQEHERFGEYLECCLDSYGGGLKEITNVPPERCFVRYEIGEGYIFATYDEAIAWVNATCAEEMEYWNASPEEVVGEIFTKIEREGK